MRKIKAMYIVNSIISFKKLLSGSSKFDVDLYWDLFDYSLELYKANDKIMAIRQEIIKNNKEEEEAIKKLKDLFNKEFDINFNIPVINKNKIDTKSVSPDDLVVLINNQIISIEQDTEKE